MMIDTYHFTATDDRYDVYPDMRCTLSGTIQGSNETDMLMTLAARFNSVGFGMADFKLKKLGEE